VWTKKGEMAFERKLRQPISNWNISGDKLIFQEKFDDPSVFIVKLFKDSTAKLFRFDFPENVVKRRVNTRWNDARQKFEIPSENEVDGNPFGDNLEAPADANSVIAMSEHS